MTSDRLARVAITGIGVVAPNGTGRDEFWRNCFAGTSGIKPITLFDTQPYRCHTGGEITAFSPEDHLGPKGIRTLDRTTRLALVAAKLALDDAKLEITPEARKDIGVVLGCTMGSVRSISEFDLEGLREGPRYVNPALFPNVVMNSPASQISIRFQLRGANSTISTGFSAGLDAIGYAMRLLQLGRVKAVVVGAVEELCLQTFLGFYCLGLLATGELESRPVFSPLHARRSGTLLGEGAAVFVLETLDEARRRGAHAHAEVLGYGTAFHPASMHRCDPSATSAVSAVREAMNEARVGAHDIDYVGACANSTRAVDTMDMAAMKTVFGSRASSTAPQCWQARLSLTPSARSSSVPPHAVQAKRALIPSPR